MTQGGSWRVACLIGDVHGCPRCHHHHLAGVVLVGAVVALGQDPTVGLTEHGLGAQSGRQQVHTSPRGLEVGQGWREGLDDLDLDVGVLLRG